MRSRGTSDGGDGTFQALMASGVAPFSFFWAARNFSRDPSLAATSSGGSGLRSLSTVVNIVHGLLLRVGDARDRDSPLCWLPRGDFRGEPTPRLGRPTLDRIGEVRVFRASLGLCRCQTWCGS